MSSSIVRYDNAAQHNLLVHAALKWNNTTEARLFSLALGCVHKNHDELPGIVIRFTEVFENASGSNYETLENACKNLMRQVVMLRKVNSKSKSTELYNIFHKLKLDSGTGLITGTFHVDIEPYLLNLTSHFTVLEIEMLLRLKSPYAHKLLWYFKSEMRDKEVVVETDLVTFRKMLLGEDHHKHYPEYFNFKRFVLNPALEEIEREIGWSITFEEVKAGLRKIVALRFNLPQIPTTLRTATKKTKKQVEATHTVAPAPAMRVNKDEPVPLVLVVKVATAQRASPSAQPAPAQQDMKSKVTERLEKLRLTPAQIKKVLDVVVGEEALTKLLKTLYEVLRPFQDVTISEVNVNNVAGLTISKLKSNYPLLYAAWSKE